VHGLECQDHVVGGWKEEGMNKIKKNKGEKEGKALP
jgi:hypothetical protein